MASIEPLHTKPNTNHKSNYSTDLGFMLLICTCFKAKDTKSVNTVKHTVQAV